jgi:hypothetical protein
MRIVAEPIVKPDDIELSKAIVCGGAHGRLAESSRASPAALLVAACAAGASAHG